MLFNSYGYFAGEYVKETGLSTKERKWNWLPKTQCKIIKKPVTEEEEINGVVAFARGMHGYYGLYERILSEQDILTLKQKGKYWSK